MLKLECLQHTLAKKIPHLFIQQIFTECMLCGRHKARHRNPGLAQGAQSLSCNTQINNN